MIPGLELHLLFQQPSLALLLMMKLHVLTQTPAAQAYSRHLDSQDGGTLKEESANEKRKETGAKAAEAAPSSAPQASEQLQRALQQMALHQQLRERQLQQLHSGFPQQPPRLLFRQQQQHSAFPPLRGQQQQSPQWQHFNNPFNLRFPAPRPPPLPPGPALGPLPSNGFGWPGRPLGY